MASIEYEHLQQKEAVLKRPEVYLGSTAPVDTMKHLYTAAGAFESKTYTLPYTFLKLADEILTNALDASVRDYEVRKIAISFDDSGKVTCSNDGMGIEVKPFKDTQRMIPEVLFTELHAGSNFKDDGSRITGGKNGLGSTIVNIWSIYFNIVIHDPKNKKTFEQTCTDNMSVVNPPKVTSKAHKKGYVKIEFVPDYKRLGINPKNPILIDIIRTRALEIAAIARKGVCVEFNGTTLPNSIAKYTHLISGANEDSVFEEFFGGPKFNMLVAVTPRAEDGVEVSAFVNGVSTNAGTHVRHVTDKLVKIVQDLVSKKYKQESVKVKPATVKDHLTIVIHLTIGDPTFGSQTKETLTTPAKNFGFAVEFTPKFISKLAKSTVIDSVYAADFQNSVSSSLKKTKLKSNGACLVDKYDQALLCNKHPERCTLILTEGDSAKSLVVAGIGSAGRETFGLFPLKGVVVNAQTMTRAKMFANTEIQNILKILNIQPGNTKGLRYHKLAIFSDADVDGTHIAGLVINFFHCVFPELVCREGGFLYRILSPIIRTRHNRTGAEDSFLTLPDFKAWQQTNDSKQYTIRYLKGLGSSTSKEAKALFSAETYAAMLLKFGISDTTDATLKTFFADETEHIAERKNLIMNYDPEKVLDISSRSATIDDFLTDDMIHFSVYSVQRAIPCVLDGFAPAKRKIVYYFLQCSKNKGMEKVAQAAANCAAKTMYHHGEVSLTEAVIGIAQDFVGAGNSPLLERQGQFGTRLQGGKDHAASRYIFTRASALAKALFPSEDEPIYTYRTDEGRSIEPTYYVPIVPIVLLNGAAGIGTGYATKVPCHSFEQVCAVTRALMHDPMNAAVTTELVPAYVGFRGTITRKEDAASYIAEGVFERIDDYTLRITELPVGTWTENFLTEMKGIAEGTKKGKLVPSDLVNRSSDMLVDIELTFAESIAEYDDEDIIKALKLRSSLSVANMYLFDRDYSLQKYESTLDIARAHCQVRLEFYEKRKAYQLQCLHIKKEVASQRIKFIQLIIQETMKLKGKPRAVLIAECVEHGLPAIKTNMDSEESHDHLLSLSIHSFTEEHIEKLKNELSQLEQQIKTLEASTLQDLWEADLRVAEKAYAAYLEEYEEKCTPIDSSSSSSKRGTSSSLKSRGGKRVKAPGNGAAASSGSAPKKKARK